MCGPLFPGAMRAAASAERTAAAQEASAEASDRVEWLPMEMFADLQGAVDMHYHSAPDFCRRLETATQAAHWARAVGMLGLGMKGHTVSTVERAKAAEEAVPGFRVVGSIVLNSSDGRIDVEAAEACLRAGAGMVWGPSMWAQHHLDYIKQHYEEGYDVLGLRFPEVGVQALDEKGHLKRELVEICKLVAKHDACLCTSHFGDEERRRLLEVALDVGVKKIVINHPNYQVTPISIEEQKEWASHGCFIEFSYSPITPQWMLIDPVRGWTPRRVAETIKEVGAKHCIVTSDMGQMHNPPLVEGMRQMVILMREWGLDDRDIDYVARRNPAHVLGL